MKTAFRSFPTIPLLVFVLWIIVGWPQRIRGRLSSHDNTMAAAKMPAAPDTQQLRQSAWFSIVSKQIEQDMYHFRQGKGLSMQSENPLQSITGTYSYDHMQLEPMDGGVAQADKNKWKMGLQLVNISFNGNPYYFPVKDAKVKQHDSSLVFDHAGAFEVQYLNTPEGVRQNFIVSRGPERMKAAERIDVNMLVG